MERERLTHLLAEPGRVAKQDLAGLEELATRYPWFSAAHLLLAVGEHGAGEVLFDERARTAAAHLPKRSVLFDLVHVPEPEPELAGAVAEVPVAPILPAALPLAEPIRVGPAAAAVAEMLSEAPPTVEVIAHLPAVPVTPPEPLAPVQVTALPPITEARPAARTEPEVDPLDQLIRQSAMASGYELIMEHALPTEAPAPAPVVDALPAPAPAPAQRSTAAMLPTGKLRFTDWLSMDAPSDPRPPDPPSLPVQTPDTRDWLRTETAPVAYSEPAPAAPLTTATAPTVEPFVLIDRFIRQEHPEPVKRAEFFTPQQAAKRSLEDHAELVTETLARIYEKQGNVAKAIAAYKRLAERHPEKSAHFLGLAAALDGRGKG